MNDIKDTVLKYWKSWQTDKRSDMEETVSENFEFHLAGVKTSMTKQSLLEASFETGTRWRDVEMISEVYADKSAALYYKGINTATDEPVFVSEHVYLDSDGLIAKVHTLVFNPPPS